MSSTGTILSKSTSAIPTSINTPILLALSLSRNLYSISHEIITFRYYFAITLALACYIGYSTV